MPLTSSRALMTLTVLLCVGCGPRPKPAPNTAPLRGGEQVAREGSEATQARLDREGTQSVIKASSASPQAATKGELAREQADTPAAQARGEEDQLRACTTACQASPPRALMTRGPTPDMLCASEVCPQRCAQAKQLKAITATDQAACVSQCDQERPQDATDAPHSAPGLDKAGASPCELMCACAHGAL